MCILEDKSDLENSVMQKKIKIPKLSLSHLEDDGEVKDYGEEDLQLRHIKVTTSLLFLDLHGSDFVFLRAKEFQSGLLLHINVPGVIGHGHCFVGVFLEEEEDACDSSCILPMACCSESPHLDCTTRHSPVAVCAVAWLLEI